MFNKSIFALSLLALTVACNNHEANTEFSSPILADEPEGQRIQRLGVVSPHFDEVPEWVNAQLKEHQNSNLGWGNCSVMEYSGCLWTAWSEQHGEIIVRTNSGLELQPSISFTELCPDSGSPCDRNWVLQEVVSELNHRGGILLEIQGYRY